MRTKVVITGAAGLVGQNLLVKLCRNKELAQIYDVTAIDKNQEKLDVAQSLHENLRTVCADLKKDGDWEDHFKNADIVVQLHAQIADPEKKPYVDNNIVAIQKVMDVCKKHKVKHVVHASSSVVISVADDLYTNTKKEGERIVAQSKVPHTILRPPLMYGCFDYKHLGFLTNLMESTPAFPMPGNGKYMRQPLYVGDLCEVIVASMRMGPDNKVHNIIGKERIDFVDLLKIIRKERQLWRVIIPIPIPLFLIMLKVHGIVTGKKPFVKDQLLALTAGDDFPLSDWEAHFHVPYTPFEEGMKKSIKSVYSKYRSGKVERVE